MTEERAAPPGETASKPPYAKYAFNNLFNYSAMVGFFSAAMLTGDWWLAVAGAGVEAVWMLFAPDSRLLRRAWFDRRHAEQLAAQRKQELDAIVDKLPEPEATRCRALRIKQAQINQLVKSNPAFTVELLRGELGKLDELVSSFIELSVTCARYRDYLKAIDLDEMERDMRRYQQLAERASDPEARGLAQKNLQVLEKRKAKYAEIRSYLSSAWGQLDLIENTFELLADQVVTMRSPTELSGQLDELMDGVEAVRQTTRETDRLLQAAEH
jgi:hypothetical protein